MSRVKAWHVNLAGAVLNLGAGVANAQLMDATASSIIFGAAFLALGLLGTVASIPSTALLLVGRLQRVAAVLNVLVAAGLFVIFMVPSLTFGVFLLVGAALAWREAGQ